MKRTVHSGLRLVLRLVVAALTAGAATLAQAEVIEIDPAGNVLHRSGAGAVEWTERGAPIDAPIANRDSNESLMEVDISALPVAALTPLNGMVSPAAYQDMLIRAANHAGISPTLLEALVWQESRWNPRAISPAGAIGLGQLMPGTARQLGVDPRDPQSNLIGAALYLRQQLDRFNGDVELALAAYNAGPRRVEKAGGIPRITETRNYVLVITRRLAARARTD